MKTTDLKELLATVNCIREEIHPHLDAPFLEAVIRAEEENPENDIEAMRSIENALKVVLISKGVSDA